MYECTFQPKHFTGWGSEGVKPLATANGFLTTVDITNNKFIDTGHFYIAWIKFASTGYFYTGKAFSFSCCKCCSNRHQCILVPQWGKGPELWNHSFQHILDPWKPPSSMPVSFSIGEKQVVRGQVCTSGVCVWEHGQSASLGRKQQHWLCEGWPYEKVAFLAYQLEGALSPADYISYHFITSRLYQLSFYEKWFSRNMWQQAQFFYLYKVYGYWAARAEIHGMGWKTFASPETYLSSINICLGLFWVP